MNILFSPASQRSRDLGQAMLRIVTGIVFLAHGWMKFGFGVAGVTGMFTQMGAPLPGLTGPLIMLLETLGAIALIAGVLSRWVAIGFICDMLGAILIVKLAGGLVGPRGFELELMLGTAATAIALGGSGACSIDGLLARRTAVTA